MNARADRVDNIVDIVGRRGYDSPNKLSRGMVYQGGMRIVQQWYGEWVFEGWLLGDI